jgi:drug/metabolite transporter (DMT)-like permease
VALVVVLILAGAVMAEQERRPRRAFILLALLAFAGALLAFSASVLATRVVLPETSRYPMWQLALVIGASITSLWHGRALRVASASPSSRLSE